MKSLWSDREAEEFGGDLGLRVYTSRLLGRDKSLVLHGGGNTSVKIQEKNLFGEQETILYVKGSGWDLETIEPQGFSPVRLAHVLRLAELPALSDPEMVNQLVTHMLKASAPAPSIETILHGLMPQKFVDHTHADAVLSVSNTKDGEKRVREVYGKRCVVIPYLIPGFDLAQFCAKEFRAQGTKDTVGMVLLNHGIFSFGDTARESYERMIELVTLAEKYLDSKDAWMVANYLKTLGYVDTERVGVWGLSYGGFFTLIAVTDQPKLFRAAVDVAGVADYAMYYEDPYHGGWTASRIGTPDQNPAVYAQASPISHVDRLERPLLVLHGTADVNVPYLHSVRLIDELMKKGKGDLVTFMTYPGEFHYFTREHVLRDAWHRVERFFDANLR